MNSARQRFLDRVRQAVAQGNQGGSAAPLPARGDIGYQGAGSDPCARFCAELGAAGGKPQRVPDAPTAIRVILDLVRTLAPRRIVLGNSPLLDTLALLGPLKLCGADVVDMQNLPLVRSREVLLAADLGISGVDYLIAETGSIALRSRPEQPRSLSLLPPVHLAVAWRSQILPDLFDLFPPGLAMSEGDMSSCWSLITGPSKTGDIELRLVTGVHGPGEVFVVLIDQG